MNRKIIMKVILPVLIIVEISFLFLSCMSFSNKNVEKIKEVSKVDKKSFSMYIMNEETGDYEKMADTVNFPGGKYNINTTKSSCEDSIGRAVDLSAVSFKNGKVKISSNKTIYCTLYFDIAPDIAISLSGTTGTNQTGKYVKSIDCGTTGSATFNQIYQRVEIGSITAPANCTLKYTADTASYTTLKSKVEKVNANQNYDENGFRYSGKTPDNWVWFNGEKWRIIGSIPVCLTANCGKSTSNLVKIIRSEPIGAYAYDAKSSGYTGVWGSNTLYDLLNTYYYAKDATKMNGQSHAGCYEYYDFTYQPKPNCDYTEIGILSSSYYGKMVRDVFWNTGASSDSVTPSAAYTAETGTQTVPGHVGLMTASDWGYAASSSYHGKKMNTYTSSSNKATEYSWIFNNGYEWTSVQHSSITDSALYVTDNGILFYTSAYFGYAVRPVVYLDSSVYIISGDGTEGNPYQIGM